MRFYTQTERLSEDNKHEREGFEQIQSEQSKLYNQWIESNETLLPFFKGSMEGPFKDQGMILQSALLDGFKHYSAHFFPEFSWHEESFWEDLSAYLSFLSLTSSQKRKELKRAVSIGVNLTNEREYPIHFKNQGEFTNGVLGYLSDIRVNAYRNFPEEWESLRIQYIESAVALFNHPCCTPALAGKILSTVKGISGSLQVNETINKAWADFQQGQLPTGVKMEQHKSLPIKQGFRWALILGLCSFGVVLLNWIFSTEEATTTQGSHSSLVYFSVEERKHIDSSLKQAKAIHSDVTVLSSNGGLSFTIRQAFLNREAEAIYTELTDGLNQYYFNPNPLKDTVQSKVLLNTRVFSKSSGKAMIKVKNNAYYHMLVIGFLNNPGAPVFSQLIASNSTETIRLTKGMKVLFLPGRKFTGDSKTPFNEWDFNYDQALQQLYTFEGGSSYSMIFHGGLGEEVTFTNPYQVFTLTQ